MTAGAVLLIECQPSTRIHEGLPMWDERYSADEYVYGKEPNDFLVECLDFVPRGKVLCLADGEGRNSVYLAEAGCETTSVDASAPGIRKAEKLAAERGVFIHTVVADLTDFEIEPDSWDAVISIFCHLPPELRKKVHQHVVAGLKPGGVLVLEAYTPEQIVLATGGPAVPEMTMTLETLQKELHGLEFISGEEKQRDVVEGIYHTGRGAVVQVVARKPKP